MILICILIVNYLPKGSGAVSRQTERSLDQQPESVFPAPGGCTQRATALMIPSDPYRLTELALMYFGLVQ